MLKFPFIDREFDYNELSYTLVKFHFEKNLNEIKFMFYLQILINLISFSKPNKNSLLMKKQEQKTSTKIPTKNKTKSPKKKIINCKKTPTKKQR